jgi:DNA-binding response OmpR family regulator
MSYKILVIDDDANICELFKFYLSKEDYIVSTAQDAQEGISVFKFFKPDLILLDIMMPDKDGYVLCREIREMSSVPIIMVTGKDEEFDKVLGLELGADDYIVKPFGMKEVCARIKAILRRTTNSVEETEIEAVKFEHFEISIVKYELKLRNKVIEIPPKELELLYFFAANPNRVFTRDQLLDKVWGFDYLGDSRTVDVHVKRLREKVDGVSEYWQLKTVWGVGYKFELV